jgi:hypothetical protein
MNVLQKMLKFFLSFRTKANVMLYVVNLQPAVNSVDFVFNVAQEMSPNELITSLTEPPIQRHPHRYWSHDLLV